MEAVMFEDSTFESAGKIHTRSRAWMIAALVLNGSILAALILIPLIHPEALPHNGSLFLMEAPKPPVEQPKALRAEHATVVRPQVEDGHLFAPSTIPHQVAVAAGPEVLERIDAAELGGPSTGIGHGDNPFAGTSNKPVVREAPQGPIHVSTIAMSSPIYETKPVYPAIAKATGTQGTVVLQAIISKSGTIENLRVVSGPALLQQAALDAVKQWRYRPFLLNGEPVEVETTVNVVFTLGR
jgi:periplasmic protein TonB